MDRPNLLGAQKRGAQTDKSHKIIHLKLINPHRTQGQTTETCRVKQMDNSSSSFRSAAANNSSNSRTRPNVRRCDLCNCTVHGGPASWKTHTEGERFPPHAAAAAPRASGPVLTHYYSSLQLKLSSTQCLFVPNSPPHPPIPQTTLVLLQAYSTGATRPAAG